MADRRQILEDAVITIMVCLPVKSLVRFRCVSKFWSNLILNPAFINKHFMKRRKKGNMLLIRSYVPLPKDDDIMSFLNTDSPELEEVLPNLSIPFLKDLKYRYGRSPGNLFLMGPCRGLVCIVYDDFIMFCNPSLREFKKLPQCPFSCPKDRVQDTLGVGFGNSCTDDFKCVFIRSTNDERYSPEEYRVIVHLYDSRTDSWRQVDENSTKMTYIWYSPCKEVLFNSICHWSARSDVMQASQEDIILCFNFNSEVFTQLVYPDCLKVVDKTLSFLTVINECIVLFTRDRPGFEDPCLIQGWTMKEYGVKESWTKQFVIGPCLAARLLSPWRHDECLLMETSNGQLASCALYTDQVEKLLVYGVKNSLRALIYKESLITINKT